MNIQMIRIEDIKYPDNTESLVEPELLESIVRNGILTPLIIKEDGTIIDGRSRYFAALEAGLTELPFYEIPVNPINYARSLKNILIITGITIEELAQKLGKSVDWVKQMLSLLEDL